MSVTRITPRRLSTERVLEEGTVSPSYDFGYLIETDSDKDTEAVIERHFLQRASLPYPGRLVYLPWIGNHVVVRNWRLERVGTRTWNLTGNADLPQTPDEQQPPQPQQPESWTPSVAITFSPLAQPVRSATFHGFFRDMKHGPVMPPQMRIREDYPICNSAMTPLDDPPSVEHYVTVLRLSYYQRQLSLPEGTVKQVVNSRPFSISWPRIGFYLRVQRTWQALLKHQGAEMVQRGNFIVWQVSTELHIHPETWALWILDQGYEETAERRAGEASQNPITTERIATRTGHAVTPRLLNGQGRELKIFPTSRFSAYYGLWMPYEEMDFRPLFRW